MKQKKKPTKQYKIEINATVIDGHISVSQEATATVGRISAIDVCGALEIAKSAIIAKTTSL